MKAKMETDIVIVTHLPSFYKIHLYNRLAKSKKIFVIFIGLSSADREKDFTKSEMNFPFAVVNKTDFQTRNIFFSSKHTLSLLRTIHYKNIIVNGWDLPEFWVSVIASFRASKGVAVESSVYESNAKGLKGLSKRLFLSFLNFALPSGQPQLALLEALGFKGLVRKVGGVGIPSLVTRNYKTEKNKINRFIFIGRLVQEKNLVFLINFFNQHPEYQLTIVGTGVLENELGQLSGKNITFSGYVANKDLLTLFAVHDILILPSTSEPWGLVVEEALQNGLPVIVSDRVGCHMDLVDKYHAGITFKSKSEDSLLQAVTFMCNPENYNSFCSAIRKMNFDEFYESQVNTYQLNWLKA